VEISGIKVGKYQNTKISKNCSGILSAFRYLGRIVKNCN
jgi:hypothetical protein